LTAFLHVSLAGPAFVAAKDIRFAYLVTDQLHSPAAMVMKEKKLLEAAGFNVTWNEFLAGSYAMQDMVAGVIDFAVCGAVPIMITHAQSMALAILASANQEGSSLVVNTSIKTIKDLNNKKIGTPGIGSIQDAMVTRMAADNTIRIRRATMKVADMPLFLQHGEIDGFIAWAPHPTRAAEHGFGHKLLTSHDMMPGHQCCVLVTRKDTLRNDLETVSVVLKIYLDAYKWFLDNQNESVKMMAKATGMSEAIVRKALKTVKYPDPPYCNMASMRAMAQGLIETDKITSVKAADLSPFMKSLYHPELLEKFSGARQPNP
jgi:NitT/TauT family transport system substrate-binding protein